jgi:hypothetical protein
MGTAPRSLPVALSYARSSALAANSRLAASAPQSVIGFTDNQNLHSGASRLMSGKQILETTSDSRGQFGFENLDAGVYQVQVVQPVVFTKRGRPGWLLVTRKGRGARFLVRTSPIYR